VSSAILFAIRSVALSKLFFRLYGLDPKKNEKGEKKNGKGSERSVLNGRVEEEGEVGNPVFLSKKVLSFKAPRSFSSL